MNLGTATEQKCPQNAIFNIHEFLYGDAFYVTTDLLFSTSLSKGFFTTTDTLSMFRQID